MKLKGEVVTNKAICALLDSGSTHSFINPVVIDGIKCKLVKTNPMVVMMANGEKMVTDTKCQDLQYTLQGFEFTDNFMLLVRVMT
jgi:hypothetical protein